MILYSTNCVRCRILENELSRLKLPFTLVTDIRVIIDKGFMQMPVLELENGNTLDFSSAMKYITMEDNNDKTN